MTLSLNFLSHSYACKTQQKTLVLLFKTVIILGAAQLPQADHGTAAQYIKPTQIPSKLHFSQRLHSVVVKHFPDLILYDHKNVSFLIFPDSFLPKTFRLILTGVLSKQLVFLCAKLHARGTRSILLPRFPRHPDEEADSYWVPFY